MENNLVEKLSEKLICLEEDLFSRMINNIKILEKNEDENNQGESKVEKLNRKLKKGRSLL